MMSDTLASTKLQLEALPNELFLEILQYVDPIDLRSFQGLNKRIDHIIHVLKVNIVIQCQEEEELDYLASFAPVQVIRLEIRDYWTSLNFTAMTELRSLVLDCTYLSREQLDQIGDIILPCLERLAVENVTYDLREPLLNAIFGGEHFPSLKTCLLKFRHFYNLELNDNKSSSDNVLRSLVIDEWSWDELNPLLCQLPNLRRLETRFEESFATIVNTIQPHLSIRHLRVTLSDPLNDLKELLKWTPNITRLRVRGNIGRNIVIDHFEKMAKFFRTFVPHLQYFDCELYCYSYDRQEKEIVIQQLHPFFRRVRCLSGTGQNQCYATDIKTYPVDNEYEVIEQPVRRLASYGGYSYKDEDDYGRYDSDGRDDDHDSFVDYGLGYRGNYKRNYGSSPWSGNND